MKVARKLGLALAPAGKRIEPALVCSIAAVATGRQSISAACLRKDTSAISTCRPVFARVFEFALY